MSEIISEEDQPRRRRIPLKLLVIIGVVIAFAIGMAVEIYKHSDGRMKSLLADNKQSFEACAGFFGPKGSASYKPSDAVEKATDEDPSSRIRRSTYATVEFLADKYKEEPIFADLDKLSDAGVQKITLTDSGEVKFYTDTNSGLCYISPEVQAQPGFYYPEGYLDENRIDGDWYRFGTDVKKNNN